VPKQHSYRTAYEGVLKPALGAHAPLFGYDVRNEFYLNVLAQHHVLEPGKSLLDLGAGLCVFGPLCKALGLSVSLMDDYGGGDWITGKLTKAAVDDVLALFRGPLGIQVLQQDIMQLPLPFRDESLDVVTAFHIFEHFHNSPKPLLEEIGRVLKPGGVLFVATPNSVNLRKRASVLLGRSNLPDLDEYLFQGHPVFRGHVREPTLSELKSLVEFAGLAIEGVYGRNVLAGGSTALRKFVPQRLLARGVGAVDGLLRCFPTLCSDIHVVGRKANGTLTRK
jgi:SAM-dependent methyltransferase